MRLIVIAAAILLTTACTRSTAQQPVSQDPSLAEIQTIESVDPRPQVIDPPAMLQDEAPPPKPKTQPWETAQPIVLTPEDEKLRASLPFSPPIAMDPVDGSKISMRATTPTLEYKGKIYYFSNEANRRAFSSNPEEAIRGGMVRL
ncbi:MAG TPA: YHS domain-containing protein [Thermoanaerobaculia bacterium]|nr:YHS domain-containing protein [Thermoanaerobaculia bacterium]